MDKPRGFHNTFDNGCIPMDLSLPTKSSQEEVFEINNLEKNNPLRTIQRQNFEERFFADLAISHAPVLPGSQNRTVNLTDKSTKEQNENAKAELIPVASFEIANQQLSTNTTAAETTGDHRPNANVSISDLGSKIPYQHDYVLETPYSSQQSILQGFSQSGAEEQMDLYQSEDLHQHIERNKLAFQQDNGNLYTDISRGTVIQLESGLELDNLQGSSLENRLQRNSLQGNKIQGNVLQANSLQGNALQGSDIQRNSLQSNAPQETDNNMEDVCAAVGINQSYNLVDFLSSLELQSRWVGDVPRVQGQTDADVNPESEEQLDHQKALRIANILNDLAFNSDSEDFLPSEADDLWTSDLEEPVTLTEPSGRAKGATMSHHHPGKWRPGQNPHAKKKAPTQTGAPSRGTQMNRGKWKPSGKLAAMRKLKTDKPSHARPRGKQMSAKLKAMQKMKAAVLPEPETRWHWEERLRDRSKFRKVWLEGKKTKKAAKDIVQVESLPSKRGKDSTRSPQKKRTFADETEDLPPEMREAESEDNEDEVLPLDFFCETCDTRLHSHGHYTRHLRSQSHLKSVKGKEVSTNEVELDEQTERFEVHHSKSNVSDKKHDGKVPSKHQIKTGKIEGNQAKKHIIVECTICIKSFSSKYLFARHLATNSHLQRAQSCSRLMLLDESVQVLLLRQSRFQCLICSFFSAKKEFFLQHMTTCEHVERVRSLLGPLKCVRCKFVSQANNELVAHLEGESHDLQTEASGRPCIVKESRTKIPCPRCAAIVQSASRLKMHLKMCKGVAYSKCKRNGKKESMCSYCGQIFSSNYAVTIHTRRRHTKERPFRCNWCDVTFADRHSLKTHQMSVAHLEHSAIQLPPRSHDGQDATAPNKESKTKVYKCRHCDHTTKVYSALRPHFFANHAAHLQDECSTNLSDNTPGGTRCSSNTEITHPPNNPKQTDVTNQFKCSHCDKPCKDQKSLKFHELSHSYPLSEKQLAKEHPAGVIAGINSEHLHFIESIKSLPLVAKVCCPECKKQMPRSKVYAHLRSHEGVKLFQCPYCDKSLASAATLRQHIHAHLQIKGHKCAECQRTFSSRNLLRDHINEKHAANPEPLAKCQQCGETFASSRLLYRHQLTHASPYKCSVEGCFYTTKYKADLKVHMKTHTANKDFLCNLCGFASKRKGGLLEHMKSHTGQRNFTCEYCDYKAKTGAHLRRHMRVHIGAKPFNCHYCSYKCATLENLHKHIQSTKKHIGLPVYPCKLCKFGTNTSRDFRNHLIGQHEVDPSQIGKMLASYCGIYDETLDPKDIPEGSCALPVREPKPKQCEDGSRHKKGKPKMQRKSNGNKCNTDVGMTPHQNEVNASQDLITSLPYHLETQSDIQDLQGNNQDTVVQEDVQIYPDIQSLLQHLTQGGGVVTSVEEGNDLEIQGQVEISGF